MSEYYKNKRLIELQAGIFVLVILAILVLGYGWLRNSFSVKDKTEVKVLFENASSLMKGDVITCFGVPRGKIKDVSITPDGALMILQIDADVPLVKGTKFIIKETDLMGNKQIDIVPGESNSSLDLNRIYQGSIESGISGAISKGHKLLTELNKVLTQLQNEDGLLNNTNTLIKKSEETIILFNEEIPIILSELSRSISEANNLILSANRIMNKNEEAIDAAFSKLPLAIDNLSSTLKDINALSRKINSLSDSLLHKENSVNKLLYDDELYQEIKSTVNSADSLLNDIKKNPKKYLELKVF